MRIALLGYGQMGRMVEQAAARQGVEVACVIDPLAGSRGKITDAEVAIDFTEPGVVISNIGLAAESGLSIVVGTTGWHDRMDEARGLVNQHGVGLVYGSNFSIGVNLMFKIVAYSAQLFARFPAFDPFIEEAHHKFKKDAPSGTALSLKRIVEREYEREVPASSTRAGYMPGSHTVGFDSAADTLTVNHTARNREGFAEGALMAARWIAGRKGFYEFSEIIEEMLK
ncbi:MAG TPA: dihydrodipicolinate reductase C-terminal domain-containing protein [Blastocatellia bacterium]|nr:dihydrodipicolinate reductase C-terminal domain-containing protein [Blastocatellia bacterium]